jgi:hypothetical protein
MKIGLIDVDGHNFPNLALMKISAFHKAKGNSTKFVTIGNYDKTYMSKTFTFSPDHNNGFGNYGEIIKGGTGFNKTNTLPDEIEHIMPDYSLYNENKAYGFLTRGCVNKCNWCIVPKKEGSIMKNADITEFWNGQKEAILLDNNVLAHDHGLRQIEKIIDLRIRVDFNQGLDARLIAENKDIAKLLSRVKWSRYLRMACDTKKQIPYIEKALSNLNEFGFKNYRAFVYLLVKEIEDAHLRAKFLKEKGCKPFAQPYRDFENKIIPSIEQKKFSRWVNHAAIFNKVDFFDYCA